MFLRQTTLVSAYMGDIFRSHRSIEIFMIWKPELWDLVETQETHETKFESCETCQTQFETHKMWQITNIVFPWMIGCIHYFFYGITYTHVGLTDILVHHKLLQTMQHCNAFWFSNGCYHAIFFQKANRTSIMQKKLTKAWSMQLHLQHKTQVNATDPQPNWYNSW